MKRIKNIFLGLIVCALSASSLAGPRVAIMDFDNRTQRGDWRIGQGAADILTTELVKATDFDVFERSKLASVLTEQNMANGARFDTATAARIGKLIGVQYIITGAVTEYGQSKSGAGGAGFNLGKQGYFASVDVRIVDANTGQVLFAETGDGKKSSVNVRVFGIGGGEKWNEKHATASMRLAIKDVAEKLATAELSPKQTGPIEILVADVDGNLITFNQGSGAGLASGDVLTVKRQGKVIKDPSTGNVIRIKYTTVGKVKLTAVEAGYSEGKVMSGANIANGDKASK
ncbi:MAG: curli biogenesis system outer membrane secretion channel CsgG [Candidatus Endobugula sp.]|jgi:curli biogenesis system outer membrane secretion channel CsgG